MAKSGIKKVVLANSGGLDTSVIVKWLQEEYGCEVATFEEDAGAYDQGDATGFIRLNALRLRVAGRKRN